MYPYTLTRQFTGQLKKYSVGKIIISHIDNKAVFLFSTGNHKKKTKKKTEKKTNKQKETKNQKRF